MKDVSRVIGMFVLTAAFVMAVSLTWAI